MKEILYSRVIPALKSLKFQHWGDSRACALDEFGAKSFVLTFSEFLQLLVTPTSELSKICWRTRRDFLRLYWRVTSYIVSYWMSIAVCSNADNYSVVCWILWYKNSAASVSFERFMEDNMILYFQGLVSHSVILYYIPSTLIGWIVRIRYIDDSFSEPARAPSTDSLVPCYLTCSSAFPIV
jgi:hypothetical protein